jgi:hypothetical protein
MIDFGCQSVAQQIHCVVAMRQYGYECTNLALESHAALSGQHGQRTLICRVLAGSLGLLFGTVENSFRSDAITTELPVILSIGGLWIPA